MKKMLVSFGILGVAAFDPPWTPAFLRRNAGMLRTEEVQELAGARLQNGLDRGVSFHV